MKGLKTNESAYKRQKDDDKKREMEYVVQMENEMSNVLIELDVRTFNKKLSEFV